jgi:hypothetical protein
MLSVSIIPLILSVAVIPLIQSGVLLSVDMLSALYAEC